MRSGERCLRCAFRLIIHVLYQGRIVKTAGPELSKEIELKGYDWIKAELAQAGE